MPQTAFVGDYLFIFVTTHLLDFRLTDLTFRVLPYIFSRE